jgi:hypothetical protein
LQVLGSYRLSDKGALALMRAAPELHTLAITSAMNLRDVASHLPSLLPGLRYHTSLIPNT